MGRWLGKWPVTQRQGCRWRRWWPSRRLHRSQQPRLRSGRRKVFFVKELEAATLIFSATDLGIIWLRRSSLFFISTSSFAMLSCARTLLLNIFCIFYSGSIFLPPSTWFSRFPTRARPSTRRTAGCKEREMGTDSLVHYCTIEYGHYRHTQNDRLT